METVFDIETNGLLDVVNRVHVVSYKDETMRDPVSIYDYNDIKEFFKQDRVFIGHHIIGYDFPALSKVLQVTLMPNRKSYGLEGFGVDYGVPKPVVKDWENLTREDYTFRCESDVKINWRLWEDLRRKLGELYG
jgi:hypothetical protein